MDKRIPPESSPNLPVIPDRGDDFLERVLRVCHLREESRRRRVEIVRKHAPAPFYEHAEVAFVEESGEARTYALAATMGALTDDLLDRFLEIHSEYRRTDQWATSTLVYGGEPADEAIVKRGRHAGVLVRSFVEFQGLVDFRPYLEKQNRRLENDAVYPPRLYVEQRMRLLVGAEEGEAEDAVSKVEEWLGSPYGRFILVLGDFGTGKTFLMHELARRLGRPRGAGGLCPVLVEMRALEKSQSLDGLIAQHLAVSGMERIDLKAFRYMLSEGRIALLFDGFDELALRVTYERAVDHFDTLMQAAGGNAKVVVTSRTQHFYSDQQVKSALAEKAAVLPGYRVATLSQFSEKQIRRFLVKKLDGDGEMAEARYRLLDEVKDLLGLSQNPRMLSFISDIPDEDLWRAKEREGEITAAALYRLLLDRWLMHEDVRADPRGGAPGLTTAQRWSAVEALAKRLWQKTGRTVNVSELPEEVGKAVLDLGGQLDVRTAAHQVGSGTLLVRDDKGNFSFIHQSVQEWLVAHAAAAEVSRTGFSPSLLPREMSPLMAEFFTALAGAEPAARWAQAVLRGDGGETAKRNAQLVLQRLGVEAGRGANLAGQNLRGRDLIGQNLRGADLRGTDLSEARLVRAVLSDANLRGARLTGADLTAAPLDGADLSDADLSFARLLGADLRGAKLLGARLRATKLVGAKIDPRVFDNSDHFGAALPLPERIEVQCAASSPCRSVAYSPEGDLIASGHDDGTVRIWDLGAGKALRIIQEHDGNVNAITWSPAGHKLASAGDDGTVRVWDVATGRELLVVRKKERVRAVAWSPDGALIASAGDDRTTHIWSPVTGRELRVLRGHAGWVRTLAWSHDSKKLASGAEDGRIRLWETTGAELGVLAGHDGGVLSVAWAPGGTLLASGAEDASVRVWDVQSKRELRPLSGHRGGVRAVAWAPDGKALASAGDDRSVRIWDWEIGMETTVLEGHAAAVHSVGWSPDGKMLASGSQDKVVRVWDLSDERKFRFLEGHAPHVNFVAWSPDGKHLVQGAADHTLRLWEVGRAVEMSRLEGHEDTVFAVAWSSDGKRLASGSMDGMLSFWSTAGRPQLRKAHERSVRSVAFSPDGLLLASGSKDKTVRLWDVATGTQLRTIAQHRGTVVALAFSPDGKRLASGSTDSTVRLLDPATGEVLLTFEEHARAVQAVAFSPDGKLIASSSDDTTVRIWDPATGKVLRVIDLGPNHVTLSLAWDSGGKLIVGGGTDGKVRVWEALTGAARMVMRGHGSPVWSVAFRPDGLLVATSSSDGTVRLWDPATSACLAVLLSLPEGWVAFAPDGRYKHGGDIGGAFWHVVGLCRFEPGELDPYLPAPLRVADDAALVIFPGETAPGATAAD